MVLHFKHNSSVWGSHLLEVCESEDQDESPDDAPSSWVPLASCRVPPVTSPGWEVMHAT